MSALPIEKSKTLVLNKCWTPMHTVPLKEALCLVFNERAKIINIADYQMFSWDDWSKLKPEDDEETLQGARQSFKIPKVIVLTTFDKPPKVYTSFCRRRLLERDEYSCRYCGIKPSVSDLTIEHIVPRSKGGETSWTNCVIACLKCNIKKGCRSLEESGMKLLTEPKVPSYSSLRKSMIKVDTFNDFLSEMYWNIPLEK